MLPYEIQWDLVFFIYYVTGIVYSPALIALPWAYITLQSKVRKLLLLGFLGMAAALLLTGLTYGLWTGLCAKGHVLQEFSECAFGSSWMVDASTVSIFVVGLIGGGLVGATCLYLEIRQYFRAK